MAHRPGKTVLVVGADGVLGKLTADAFRDAGWMVQLAPVRAGPGGTGPEQAGPDQAGPVRAGPERIDLELDWLESVATALRENKLVVNTVPDSRLLVERLVLERGGALINTSTLPAAAGRSLRAVAAGARGVVLMNAGIAPGVTNVVAADLLREHASAKELEIVLTLSTAALRGSAAADFVHRNLTVVPRHRTARIPLPDPFGERVCLGFAEGETGWLGGVAEGRVVRVYLCIIEPANHERLLTLNRAGGMNRLPRSPFGHHRPPDIIPADIIPADTIPSREPVAHWIAVRTGSRRLAARTVECHGDSLHTARTSVVFAERLISRLRRGGCFDPEEIFTLPQIEPRLGTAGVRIVSQPV